MKTKLFTDHPWFPYPWYNKTFDAPQLGKKNRNMLQSVNMTVAIQVTRAREAYARDTNGLDLSGMRPKKNWKEYKSRNCGEALDYSDYPVLKSDRLSMHLVRRLAGLPTTYKLRATDVHEGVQYPKARS